MRGRGEDDEEAERKKSPGAKKVPFLGMFRYAGRTDLALMAVGTAAAMANGMSEPLMTIIFAAVIESFGGSDSGTVLRRVSKVVMYYIYLGIWSAVASFLQVSCWTMAGERQSTRIRSLYLEAVLKQDVSFFDVEMTTGEAISRMSADTVLVQDALGEKVGKYVQLLTTFVGGFVIGFIRGWMLALVMLASVPPSILSFATVSRLRTQISSLLRGLPSPVPIVLDRKLTISVVTSDPVIPAPGSRPRPPETDSPPAVYRGRCLPSRLKS